MDGFNNKPSVVVASALDVQQLEEAQLATLRELEEELEEPIVNSSLAGHIMSEFIINREARQTSGMENKMLESLRAYNGHYDPEDLQRIKKAGGSAIFMNLTATKCRAAMSWIRDILMSANELPWAFKPTAMPDIPKESEQRIKAEIDQFIKDRDELKQQDEQKEQQQEQQMAAQEQQAAEQAKQQGGKAPPRDNVPKPVKAANELKDINQMYRDIKEAFQDEVYKIAESEIKQLQTIVADQLTEGAWDQALSDFIEDYCVFPVAIMKGPVVTKKNRLSWEDGKPKVKEDYIFLNQRVSPLDIYPSPNANDITDGNLCEHLRLSRGDLYNLIGLDGYNEANIRDVLENTPPGSYQWLDTQVEEDKVVEEYRGDAVDANRNVYHGIHFHGCASRDLLEDWGIDESFLSEDENAEYEIEAILVGSKVIKVAINEDPLLRRPYYKASFHNIPGSWWGRSLPELMRDIQRMCNATARALSNNMGVASGPQVEVYIDRLAADEEVTDIYPFKLWQVNSDPTGAGGRAVTFWQPTSNAGELLTVYKEFEIKADDATGVPRYAYGNERTAGAAQTASGMSMLLESANKGIKDAIRHIDDGLIKPRVEYQFYWNLVTDPDITFSGDILVEPLGSQSLTMKGAQEQRRNEFLQILTNPMYLEIVGIEGAADILREMAKDLGLGTNLIPSRVELKFRQAQKAKLQQQQAQAQAEAEQQKQAVGVQQVQMQTDQAEKASQRSAQLKQMELQLKQMIETQKAQLKQLEIQQREAIESQKAELALIKQQMSDSQKDRTTNKNVALSVQSGFEDKNNQR